MNKEIITGTSGWMYKHWKGTFYPQGLKENQLVFYSGEFNTVELNYSFYRLPGAKAYAAWYANTPEDFMFAVKMNRYLSHLKRLIIDEESERVLKTFLAETRELREKLQVILIQLHPRHAADPERLERFFLTYSEIVYDMEFRPSTCIEFRNLSWFTDETYKILEKFSTALVFPNTPELRKLVFPTDFAYIRIHGFNSLSEGELKDLKSEIDQFPAKIKKVFVYFNNDWNTFAIYNARDFKKMI